MIDADADQPIKEFDPIRNNDIINLAKLPTRNLNIRANLSSDNCATEVNFKFIGRNMSFADKTPPFTLYGDTRSILTGRIDYLGVPLHPDKYEQEVTAYEETAHGDPLVITYEFVERP